jgi:hypothetical protein
MKEIKEVIVDGSIVYLKRSGKNYRVVHPIKIDGKINWKNLLVGGSYWNLLIIAVVLSLIFGLINEYISNLKLTNACLRALPDYINLGIYLENPELNSSVMFG